MTIANFKQQVANALNRSLASLTSDNSQDMILAAMNDARRTAQRDHVFELLATEDAYLSTSAAGGNWQTGCKTTPGGATVVLMRRVDEIWNYATATIGATTYYPRTTQIDYSYRGQLRRELPKVSNNMNVVSPQSYFVQTKFGYCTGQNLYITTVQEATIYKLVGVQWLDDLTGAESPDIFLTYFTDWFRYATIAALNYYLKDGERFPIDATTMQRLWASVKSMDGDLATMGQMNSGD